MLAILLKNKDTADYLVLQCAKKGLILFWLLFEPRAVRISPPLTLSKAEIKQGCGTILEVLMQYGQHGS